METDKNNNYGISLIPNTRTQYGIIVFDLKMMVIYKKKFE